MHLVSHTPFNNMLNILMAKLPCVCALPHPMPGEAVGPAPVHSQLWFVPLMRLRRDVARRKSNCTRLNLWPGRCCWKTLQEESRDCVLNTEQQAQGKPQRRGGTWVSGGLRSAGGMVGLRRLFPFFNEYIKIYFLLHSCRLTSSRM